MCGIRGTIRWAATGIVLWLTSAGVAGGAGGAAKAGGWDVAGVTTGVAELVWCAAGFAATGAGCVVAPDAGPPRWPTPVVTLVTTWVVAGATIPVTVCTVVPSVVVTPLTSPLVTLVTVPVRLPSV